MSLCLSQDELVEVLRYKRLKSPGYPDIYPFGVQVSDFGDCHETLDEWFHEQKQRFLFALPDLPRIPHKMNDGPWGEGVYFLFKDDELVYVGQAKYIQQRLNRHGYPPPQKHHVDWFNNYACLWVPLMFLDSLESYYIHKFDPPRNVKLPPKYEPACDYL